MAICDGILTGDILDACPDNAFGGIEVNVLFFNRRDIDKTVITLDTVNPLKVTGFALKTTKTGFLVKGIKQSNELLYSLVKKETTANKFKHTFKGLQKFALPERRYLQAFASFVFCIVVLLQ